MMETLSPLEKELVKTLHRVEIRGKKGRMVPILLTRDMKKAADALLQSRFAAGVSNDNPYFCARPFFGAKTPIRGTDAIRFYSEHCGASRPELLRSTKLRKQLATVTQICTLDKNELENVATHMGHDLRVHNDLYLISTNAIQLAKVSKLLLQVERGELKTLQGKNLDEIPVSLSEELEDIDDEEAADEQNGGQPKADEQATTRDAQGHAFVEEVIAEGTSRSDNEIFRKRNGKKYKIIPWTKEEKEAVFNHRLTKEILSNPMINPNKVTCEQIIADCRFPRRDWQKIKFLINNQKRKLRRTKSD
jgi:hypothetical protein